MGTWVEKWSDKVIDRGIKKQAQGLEGVGMGAMGRGMKEWA